MVWKKIRGGVGHAHGSSPRGWGRGRVSPHAHSPWSPQLIADVPFLYTAEEQAHMGAACCTVRLTVSHMKKKEEAGICWTGDVECGEGGGDMLEMDAECGEGGGWAGM